MVEDYTKTARNSSVRQIRGCVLLDESDSQIGIASSPLYTRDLFLEIAKGNISGQKAYIIPGRKNSISSTVLDDLSQIPGTTVIPDPGGVGLEILSSSVEDGAGTQTGALTVDIEYLDTAGAEQAETLAMNGTTVVTTTATNIDKIQWIHVVTIGSNTTAVGNITLRGLSGGTAFEYIQAGGNQSLSARYTVPTGKTGFIHGWQASGITKIIDVKLRANVDRFTKTKQDVFTFQDNVVLDDATSGWIPFIIPIKIPETATVKMSAISAAAGGDAGGSFLILLIDN